MKKTRFVSVLLALSLLITVFAMGISAEETAEVSVDGTEMSFADFQNGFSEYASKSVVLLKDVVLPDDFASLGSLAVPFTGTFDGNGYTISNLKAPLFGKLQGATVQNLTLTGDIVMTGSSDNGNNGGVLTPRADGMTLRNCVSNVSLNFTPAAASCIGAWAGFCGAGTITIEQCVNNGAVTVDYSGATAHSIYVGGFIGKTNVGATISSSVNNGAVSGKTENSSNQSSNAILMGGFIGDAFKTVNVQKCVNNGAVRVTTSKGHGGHKVGGLIGVLEGGSTSNFTDCVNNGEIFAYVQAGGLVGTVNNIATLTNCYNYGDVLSGGDTTLSASSFAGGMVAHLNATGSNGVVIKNCVNYGNITSQANVSTKLEAYAGGIAGNVAGNVTLVADNCLSKGTVKAALYAGGLFGYVNATCKKAEVGNSLVTGNVLLVESSLSGAASGAVIGQNMAAATVVSFVNSSYISTVNPVAVNGTAVAGELTGTEDIQALNLPIRYVGVQYTQAQDGTFDARFVVSVDSLQYTSVGYFITRVEKNGGLGTLNRTSREVYRSLLGFDAESGAVTEYTAEDFGADYLGAIVIRQIPEDLDVSFLIAPYLIDQEGNTVTGITYTVTFSNGIMTVQN